MAHHNDIFLTNMATKRKVELIKVQAGPHYNKSVWKYRGYVIEGTPPRHGWGSQKGAGGGWSWRAEAFPTMPTQRTRADLIAEIDAAVSKAKG